MSHIEYLHEEMSDPQKYRASSRRAYWCGGYVIAWNKSFEAGVNESLGERMPEHKATMDRVNNMLYDLMDVFKNSILCTQSFAEARLLKSLPALVPGFL